MILSKEGRFSVEVSQKFCNWLWRENDYFCVHIMNGRRPITGKLGHVEQNDVCRFFVNVILSPHYNFCLLIGSLLVFMCQFL